MAFSSMPEGEMHGLGSHSYSWRIPYKDEEGADRGFLIGFVWFMAMKVCAFLLYGRIGASC